VFEGPPPAKTISLGDIATFSLSIGNRVLKSEQTEEGVPVYSANALLPFGHVEQSNLTDFSKPSLLWGIDGNFDWNLLPANYEFATTDHCGRLQVLDPRLDPEYVFVYLDLTRERYGFDRVFRASLGNIRADVSVAVPVDEAGEPSPERQRQLAAEAKSRQAAQEAALAALDDLRKARMTASM
jgi:hypothetical protein